MKQTRVLLAIIVVLMLLVIEKNNFATETQSARAPRPAIARMWHGQTSAAKAKEYTAYLQEAGIKKIQSIPGNSGVQMPEAKMQHYEVVVNQWTE